MEYLELDNKFFVRKDSLIMVVKENDVYLRIYITSPYANSIDKDSKSIISHAVNFSNRYERDEAYNQLQSLVHN